MNKRKEKRELDILNGSIAKLIPRYALPIAATGILGQLFNSADMAIVGNFTGEQGTAAVAAVGANAPLISLILNLFLGITLGASVVIANAIGKSDEDTVHKAVYTSVITAVISGILISLASQLFAPEILKLMNIPEEVFGYALKYLRIYLLGLPAIMLYNYEATFFRSIGETKIPFVVLAVSGMINIVLNLFFVIVVKMTVDGVAIATVISNAVSAVVLFVLLVKTDKVIRIIPKEIKFNKQVFAKIMKIGVPAGVQSAVFSVANIVIQSAINSLGTIAMASSSASSNIEMFAYYVMNSFSQACTTFVSHNYGAKQLKRCEKVLILCLLEDVIASVIMFTVVLFAGKFLLSMINDNPEVVEMGYVRLMTILFAYTFSIVYENLAGYMRGFGMSLTPAVLTMLGVCGVRFFWIYVIFPQSRTFATLMMAYPASLSTTAVLMLIAVLVHRPSKKIARE